jgi:PAS domain S-box-containing protein
MRQLAPAFALQFDPVFHNAFLRHSQDGNFCYWGTVGLLKELTSFLFDGNLSFSFNTFQPGQATPAEDPCTSQQSLAELYRLVTEITDDALWEWDFAKQQIFWIDGGHKRIFGYPIQNALVPKQFWESLLHKEDKKGVLQSLTFVTETGWENKWESDYRLLKQDGSYAWVHERGRIIYEDNKAVRMIGATRDITKSVLLEKKLTDESTESQRQIAEAVLAAQEMERQNLALDLNENLSQVLVAVNMFIGIAKKDEKNRDVYLEKSSGHVKDVLTEIKKMYRGLVAPNLKIAGLFDNLTNLLAELEKQYHVSIDFFKPGIKDEGLTENLQLNVYRLVQDHLKNILSFTNADTIVISISMHGQDLVLVIKDNASNRGDIPEINAHHLKNLCNRVALIDGKMILPGGSLLESILKITFRIMPATPADE